MLSANNSLASVTTTNDVDLNGQEIPLIEPVKPGAPWAIVAVMGVTGKYELLSFEENSMATDTRQ